jgi:hypothetical protein
MPAQGGLLPAFLSVYQATHRTGESMSDEAPIEARSSYSAVAILAGFAGLLSFVFGPAGIVAVLLGHVGLWRVSRSNGTLRGRGLCVFGLVLGYLALALMIYYRSQR